MGTIEETIQSAPVDTEYMSPRTVQAHCMHLPSSLESKTLPVAESNEPHNPLAIKQARPANPAPGERGKGRPPCVRCDSCMHAEKPGDYCSVWLPGEHFGGPDPEGEVPSPRSEPTTSCNRDAGAAEFSGRECRMRDPCSRGTDRFRADVSAVWSPVLIAIVTKQDRFPNRSVLYRCVEE